MYWAFPPILKIFQSAKFLMMIYYTGVRLRFFYFTSLNGNSFVMSNVH